MFRRSRPAPPPVACPSCRLEHPVAALEERLYVCAGCGRALAMPSPARIRMLADPRTFRELDRGLISVDPLQFMDRKPYRARLIEARRQTELREAVTTGSCLIGGRPVVLVVFDFEFLGGTMGSVVGEKVANAFQHATRRRLPLISVAASGGARMQEGMLSLMQMAKVAAAAARHDRARLAFISIFTDPTFGGVTASFASLGDVILAEPGAQIGFVGPRVIEQTTGTTLPKDSHRAETLLSHGLVDLIVPRDQLRGTVSYLVGHLMRSPAPHSRTAPVGGSGRDGAGTPAEGPARGPQGEPAGAAPSDPGSRGASGAARTGGGSVDAWAEVQLARHTARPTSLDYIARMTAGFVELHGDRQGGDDPAMVGGLAEFDGQTIMAIGQERGHPSNSQDRRRGMAGPGGYRKALRLARLAAKFRVPVVTFVDTPGADPSYEAERGGIALALAENLAVMSVLPTPVVSVIIGEGGSGGALALAVADHVLMLEHAIYSVISPEGAAAILYRDVAQAQALSAALKITAPDLKRLGVIDEIVPEPPGGAHLDHGTAARALAARVAASLRRLRRVSVPKLLDRRYEKYRHIGRTGVYWREVVRGEMQDALDALARRFPRGEGPWRRVKAETPPT